MSFKKSYTFDDVLLKPAYSEVLPGEVVTRTRLTKTIDLAIPIVSSAMDTVTEGEMAIAMAQAGGIGVVHRNMDIEKQVAEIRKVKKFESGMVVDPVTLPPDSRLADAIRIMDEMSISSIPVVETSGKLVGILTNRDVRFAKNMKTPVSELMTSDLVTVEAGVSKDEAKALLHKHRIEKLLVVDKKFRCVGLITVKDIEKSVKYPDATKDEHGRLRVAAATGSGEEGIERAQALFEGGADVVIVDTAHGHSKKVIETVKAITKMKNAGQIIAGNVATAEGAKMLIDAGVNGIKVGIGPGSICTTRIVAGVGVPQLTALMDTVEETVKHDIPVIADGGIRFSGDIAKSIAAGADSVMIGSLLAGTEEAPGEVFLYQGRPYKSYRGMGSLGAMVKGSADRYFQGEIKESLKLVPEGVEGKVPYKGPVTTILYQLVGGLRASMGYTGNKTIKDMRKKSTFIEISTAGMRESHVHDITITKEAPNYKPD